MKARFLARLVAVLAPAALSGCVFLPQAIGYKGPVERPPQINEYYSGNGGAIVSSLDRVANTRYGMTEREIVLTTTLGEMKIDLFQTGKPNDDLIFVFPVLGGKYMFERYFARYFTERGFDTAIVHRTNEFRDPANIDRIEEIFRNNIIRDRLVLDFFEQQYGKKDFGSFGLSRGAINASMLAGVDPRLKYNVLVLGGSNLVGMFKDSGEKGIKKFIKKVMDAKKMTREELFQFLSDRVKTDPQFVAKHIDSRNTLMILAMLDQSVPVEYGFKLRRQIGRPQTVLIPSGHYTALLYTQFVRVFPPGSMLTVFPYDFVETEALTFYNRKFKTGQWRIRELPIRIIKVPFLLLGRLGQLLF